jgi:hypothetical protein
VQVLQRLKACHSGENKGAYEQWVTITPLEQIRSEVEMLADLLPPDSTK